ncbi:MAG: chromate efflux transporter [Rhodobacteraceae bacterium]|jgi:chromate transporter|nr:MAG: chromate efflux transporter [Paracoccaceae bacterium]|tara:strand:- start:2132 stop:3397 length:1266 start_codon:yes stop_codon:yes gene_type:complete
MQSNPTLRQSTATWCKIGLLSFGGPAAQIALMHREIVENKKWLSEDQFLNALNFCMLLPGPEAMQLATYSGWRINGTLGGLIAGLLFVLPGAFLITLLAVIYAFFGDVPLINSLFLGVKATVVVIVIQALLKVSKKALKTHYHTSIAVTAFISIFFFNLPYPFIIFVSAFFGYLVLPNKINVKQVQQSQPLTKTLKTILAWLVVWWIPILLVYLISDQKILTEITIFFSKLAVVTFGGAYAVLSYMAQDVVITKDWLTAGQMMDGLGLAETTPGPLILVTEFVGFLAAFQEGGIKLALIAGFLTLWVTFIPCFLWIFAGAPYIDWISSQPRLHGALSAITAAVVGVILNLSIWFMLHVFFEKISDVQFGPINLLWPNFSYINVPAIFLTSISIWLIIKLKWNIASVLLINASLALLQSLIN